MTREVIVDNEEAVREGYKQVRSGPKTLKIPEEWSVCRFGEAFHQRRDSIEAEDGEPIRYVGLKHLESGQIHIQGYDESGKDRSSNRAFREGDVLFGKLRPNLEKAAVAPFDGICSSDIIPIYAGDGAENDFLPYLMHSKLIRDRVVSTMEGTNLPRTSWSDLKVTKVPLPPLAEQRRIAEILSTVDEKIRQTEKIIDTVEDLRDGLLQNFLQSGIGENEISEVRIGPKKVTFPREWNVERVENLLDESGDRKPLRGGPPGGKIHKKDRAEDGYKIYTQETITRRDLDYGEEYITEEKFEQLKNAEPKPGDILITRAGTVGEATVFPENAERGIIDSAIMRVCIDEEICDPHFVALLLDESYLVEFQIRAMSQSGVIRNLNNGIIRQLQIPVPPLEQQQDILSVLSSVREKLEQEQQYQERLQELRRGLMQDLLTGKVRVDPENTTGKD